MCAFELNFLEFNVIFYIHDFLRGSKIHGIRLNFDREIVQYNKNTNDQHELVLVKCWKLRIKVDKYRVLVRVSFNESIILNQFL